MVDRYDFLFAGNTISVKHHCHLQYAKFRRERYVRNTERQTGLDLFMGFPYNKKNIERHKPFYFLA